MDRTRIRVLESIYAAHGMKQSVIILGGESFANKRHNEFLKDLTETEYVLRLILLIQATEH